MNMNFRIVSIGYGEATLLPSVLLAGAICYFAGRQFARILAASRRATRVLGWLMAPMFVVVTWLLPSLILQLLYSLVHGAGAYVCTYFVGWALLLPLGAGVASAIHRTWQLRRQLAG